MRKTQLAARVRDRDLPVVHVSREHELEPVGLEAVSNNRG